MCVVCASLFARVRMLGCVCARVECARTYRYVRAHVICAHHYCVETFSYDLDMRKSVHVLYRYVRVRVMCARRYFAKPSLMI